MSAIGTLLGRGLAVAAGGALLADQFLYNVEPGHRAVIVNKVHGVVDEVKPEGTHFRIPILETPVLFDVRTTPKTIDTLSHTKNNQNVQLSLRILYRPMEEKLPVLYDTLNLNYANRVLPSISNEVLKAVVARYNADQLLTLRDKVSLEIRDGLSQRCQEFNILLDDVSITHLTFSPEFAKAIEDKQVAEQAMEKSKFLVDKAEQEQLKTIINGQADAEAAQLVSDAVKKYGRGLIEVRRIEASRDIAQTLSTSKGNVTYLPSSATGGNNMLLNLPSR